MPLPIFAKHSVLDVWQGSEYPFAYKNHAMRKTLDQIPQAIIPKSLRVVFSYLCKA